MSSSVGIIQGRGLLATTAGWLAAPLDTEAQEHLHACIVARLNPMGVLVDIWLGGGFVRDDATRPKFPIAEAFWRVQLTPDGPRFEIWPLPEIADHCDVVPAATTRVCGTASGVCGLEIRDDGKLCDAGTFACPETPGSPILKPVLGTQLSCAAWCSLYPGCSRRPERCQGEPACRQ